MSLVAAQTAQPAVVALSIFVRPACGESMSFTLHISLHCMSGNCTLSQVFAASWVEDEVQKSFTLTPFRSPAVANVRGEQALEFLNHAVHVGLLDACYLWMIMQA